MTRLWAVLVLFISSTTYAGRQAFVVNNLAETLSRIDLETGAVQNHVTLLGTTPNQLAYHDSFLYVVNSISANVQKIDPQTYQVVADMALPVGSNPYSIDFDGDYAYVTGWISGRVYRISLITNQADADIEIGGYPEGIICVGGHLYVAQTGFNPNDFSYGQGRMAVISVSGMAPESEVDVGKNPQALTLAPGGNLHVVCTGDYTSVAGSIYVFSIASGTVTDSILMGGQPASLAISRDGIAYVAAGGWSDHGYVYSYDIAGLQVLRGPSNPIVVGLGATAVAVDSLGYGYSCDFGSDTVTKFDSGGQILNTFGLGDGPSSIVVLDEHPGSVDDDEDAPLPDYPILTRCYPNPFNSEVMIEYNLSSWREQPFSIAIFDVGGRLVRTLWVETAVDHGRVLWNGRDDGGGECPSGLYFARFAPKDPTSSGFRGRAAVKMVLVK